MHKASFLRALAEDSLCQLESVPKSDLHSHAGRGGRIAYIERWANVRIAPPTEPFDSLEDMNRWLAEHVKCHCPGLSGYLKRIEAAFAQAQADHIAVLAMSFAVDEIDAFGSMQEFAAVMDRLHRDFAPDTRFLPDLALGYDVFEPRRLDEIFAAKWFSGIDVCNYAGRYTLQELRGVFRKAQEAGLILKAHIGEFGGTDDVQRYAEELALQQIQHGIAAAASPPTMRWLARHGVQLNMCPTSNILLKNARDYRSHPIRTLFDYGVPVTLNTDDLLIFDATVSQEYLHLHRAGLMTPEELNAIRETGLASCGLEAEVARARLRADRRTAHSAFHRFLREQGFTIAAEDDGNGWQILDEAACVGHMNYTEVGIWLDTCAFGDGSAADDTVKEAAWAHVRPCEHFSSGGAQCGCGRQPGFDRVLLGRAYSHLCFSHLAFIDPDADTLAHITRLLTLYRQNQRGAHDPA